ncbi:MAG: hypothetical protein Q8O33_15640, partial [Pseudomonadota bacterium]|nr:hypothetical protein [Pseudomonadota bacterium]
TPRVGCGERREPQQPDTRGMMRFAALTTSYGSCFIGRGGSQKAMTAEGQNKFALATSQAPLAPISNG